MFGLISIGEYVGYFSAGGCHGPLAPDRGGAGFGSAGGVQLELPRLAGYYARAFQAWPGRAVGGGGGGVKLYVIHATSNAFGRTHYVVAPNKADAVRQGEILLGGGYLAQCTASEVKVKGWKIVLVEPG